MPRTPRKPAISPSPLSPPPSPPRPPRRRGRKVGIPARETDLYAPVRDLLERQGFTVRGEVRGCDVVAQRGDELVIVELKRHFGLDLLLQAVARQRACESVYVALPAAALAKGGRNRARQRQLLRRLELGLLVVHFETGAEPHLSKAGASARESRQDARTTMAGASARESRRDARTTMEESRRDTRATMGGEREGSEPEGSARASEAGPHVEVALHPIESRRQLHRRGRRAIIQELAGRSGDHQPGGATRTKILTAYREAAIHVAVCLRQSGPTSPRELRAQGCAARTTSILADNHYGWFTRIERGIYALTETGHADLAGDYAEASERLKAKG